MAVAGLRRATAIRCLGEPATDASGLTIGRRAPSVGVRSAAPHAVWTSPARAACR